MTTTDSSNSTSREAQLADLAGEMAKIKKAARSMREYQDWLNEEAYWRRLDQKLAARDG